MKKRSGSSLMVTLTTNVWIHACANCCKRWFITFDGQECSPFPIDQVHYRGATTNGEHIPLGLKGLCKINKTGTVKVGLNIGNCKGHGDAKGYTGWNSVSRIVIEEVQPQV